MKGELMTTQKSTNGRTAQAGAYSTLRGARTRVTGRPPLLRRVSALFHSVRDPLGISAGLEGWSLDEADIRADLEYGRD